MDSHKLLFPLFSLFIFIFSLLSGQATSAGHRHGHFRPRKLFVFGDSYVDTGNTNSSTSSSYKFPYGITFPGEPSGRFSDGLLLTDFTAKFLGLKPPIPYTVAKKEGFSNLKHGINFAYGGTGVFNTSVPYPNMTAQIDFFHALLAASTLTGADADAALALVSVSGNDYSHYLLTNPSPDGFKSFIISVVNQMTVNLQRIRALGVKKVVAMGLGPLGCAPQITAPAFEKCNSTLDELVRFHNILLEEAVVRLNNGSGDSGFLFLDLYSRFMPLIQNGGSGKFKTPLKPCCYGVSHGFFCGSVDGEGKKKYVLCEDRKTTLFWDDVHPTQEGWAAALSSLEAKLKKLF